MQILKPQSLSLINKTYTLQNHQFATGILGFFELGGNGRLLPESAQWGKLKPLFDSGFILDMGFAKTRGEVLMTGFAHSASPVQNMSVSLTLGKLHKELMVVGDRQWQGNWFKTVSNPELFTSKPLCYSLAYGGADHAKNPIGQGAKTKSVERKGQFLANIYYPDEWQKKLNKDKRVANFGPVNIEWPQRSKFQGTYDQQWADTQHPGFPLDTDLQLFNCAPEDQQFDGFIEPGTEYCLSGVTEDGSQINGKLPDFRARTFAKLKTANEEQIVEGDNHIDTVWFFPEISLGVVIYRSVIRVNDSLGLDVTQLLLAYENQSDTPRTAEHYHNEMALRSKPETGAAKIINEAPLKPEKTEAEKQRVEALFVAVKEKQKKQRNAMVQQLARQHNLPEKLIAEKLAEQDKQNGADLPPIPEELAAELDIDLTPYLEKCDQLTEEAKQQAKEAEAQAREKAKQHAPVHTTETLESIQKRVACQIKVDIEALKRTAKSVKQFNQQQLVEFAAQSKLQTIRKARQEAPDAVFITAPLPQELSSKLRNLVIELISGGQSLSGRDLAGADLSGLDFSGLDLTDTMFEHCNLTGCNFTQTRLNGTVFTRALLDNTNFSHCHISHCNFSKVQGVRTRLSSAVMSHVMMAEAEFENGNFSQIQAEHLNAIGANLPGTDFSYAVVKNGQFTQAHCQKSQWCHADLNACFLLQANLCEASFTGAKLMRCLLIDIQARQADFSKVNADRVQFSNVGDLSGADLSNGSWQTCGFRGVLLDGANASNSGFVECDFVESQWNSADIKGALFHRCVMMQTQLTCSDCRDSFFHETTITKANMQSADFSNVRLHASDTAECDWQNCRLDNVQCTPFPIKKSRSPRTEAVS